MEDIPTKTEDPGQLTTVLLAHETARVRALKEGNRQALEVLLIPEYVEVNDFGLSSKKDVIVSILPGIVQQEHEISDPKITLLLPDTAILVYKAKRDLTLHGRHVAGMFVIGAHYVKRGHKWLLAFWQVTPVGTPGTTPA